MDRISEKEKVRIAELLAERAPAWRMHQEVHRSRHAIHRVIKALPRPKRPEPTRSPLRLSLVEREEISRGLAAGESLRGISRRLGRAPSTISRELKGQPRGGPILGLWRRQAGLAAGQAAQAGQVGTVRPTP